MNISDKGLVALLSHEGIVPGPYRDSVGVLTYGVGHTKSAGSPDPAALKTGMPANLDAELVEVFEVFKRDIAKYEAAVDKAITVPVSQHEFDAAVSFHYNTGAIATATWVKTLNSGNHSLAADQIMNWTKPPEIIPRRQAEQDLFRNGIYPTGDSIVWKVDSNYRVIWSPECTLTTSEVLGYLGDQHPDEDSYIPFPHDVEIPEIEICETCRGTGRVIKQ